MVQVELKPHVAVADFRLGMSFGEAVHTAKAWGEVLAAGPTTQSETVKVSVRHEDFKFTLIFDNGQTLGAVEVWRFRDEDADVQVTLEGIDVFRTPQDEFAELLETRGHEVEDEDFFVVRDLDVVFDNASSFEYPTDADGDPLYFDYVLVTNDTGYV